MYPQPGYIMVDPYGQLRGPPPPQYYQQRGKSNNSGGSCCLKCFCCCCCLFILFICLMMGSLIYIYNFYQPKMPLYKISDFQVLTFEIFPDSTVKSHIQIAVRAENPNDEIALMYEPGSVVVIRYEGARLCSGEIPSFMHKTNNVTMIHLDLMGVTQLGEDNVHSLMRDDKTGRIYLDVNIRVPIKVIFVDDQSSWREIVASVHCGMEIDHLKKPQILENRCLYAWHF